MPSPSNIQHGLTVEASCAGTLRSWYGEDAILARGCSRCGLEKWRRRTAKLGAAAEIGCSDEFIHAVCSHGYGLRSDVEPTEEMEKVLFAADELTGSSARRR